MHQTIVGGTVTILIQLMTLQQLYSKLSVMINYGNDTIQYNQQNTNFKKLGNVTIESLDGAIPFYAFFHSTN
jgi:hypothetical protein